MIELAEIGYENDQHNFNLVDLAGLRFTFTQSVLSDIWTIEHGLNQKYVDVLVINQNDDTVIPDITYINLNIVRLTFTSPVKGTAIVRK